MTSLAGSELRPAQWRPGHHRASAQRGTARHGKARLSGTWTASARVTIDPNCVLDHDHGDARGRQGRGSAGTGGSRSDPQDPFGSPGGKTTEEGRW